jgi:4-hydroxybenzoyl-CoA reductase subunit alpha
MSDVVRESSELRDRAVPLIDGIEKVTGRARYTADLDHAGALVGRIFRSPVSHAEIKRLDVTKARELDGVFAVVTGADCPHTYGVLPVAMNEYPLARERVRYRGEPIAAVAAVDAAAAEQALDLIEFEMHELPPIIPRQRRAPMAQRCCMTTSPAISSAKSIMSSAT